MQEFEKFVGQLSDFVWGPPLLPSYSMRERRITLPSRMSIVPISYAFR